MARGQRPATRFPVWNEPERDELDLSPDALWRLAHQRATEVVCSHRSALRSYRFRGGNFAGARSGGGG
jgi:hypothetical protein